MARPLETMLTMGICPTCETIVVTGVIGGRRVLLERQTIPYDDAAVIAKYFPGSIFNVIKGQLGLYGSDYWPTDKNYHALVHSCANRRGIRWG